MTRVLVFVYQFDQIIFCSCIRRAWGDSFLWFIICCQDLVPKKLIKMWVWSLLVSTKVFDSLVCFTSLSHVVCAVAATTLRSRHSLHEIRSIISRSFKLSLRTLSVAANWAIIWKNIIPIRRNGRSFSTSSWAYRCIRLALLHVVNTALSELAIVYFFLI